MSLTVMKDEDLPGWSDVDIAAVKRMIAAADSEGGESSLEEVALMLDTVIDAARRN